jgi:glyoxylase-like metal-dependent hydrolase (beta-lactamase superfamily II)
MNANDQELYDRIDWQASWLRMPVPERTAIDIAARDGDTIKLGETGFHVFHTPGHTQGSICLWMPAENKLISGDTLFQNSIGRTDLPGGDGRQILRSIKTKLFDLPDTALVIPGHGPNTTIGHEKQFNYFLRDL